VATMIIGEWPFNTLYITIPLLAPPPNFSSAVLNPHTQESVAAKVAVEPHFRLFSQFLDNLINFVRYFEKMGLTLHVVSCI